MQSDLYFLFIYIYIYRPHILIYIIISYFLCRYNLKWFTRGTYKVDICIFQNLKGAFK
jgi:hypothetical protein